MKIRVVPSVAHVRRAMGKDQNQVVRCRQGVIDTYPKPTPRNPNTAEQQITRDSFSGGTGTWRELAPEVKAGWSAFAAQVDRAQPRAVVQPLTGRCLFQSAAFYRTLLGLPAPDRVPVQLPPGSLSAVELLSSEEPDTLRLRIRHGLRPGAFSVVVSMTPPTLRPTRKPDRRNARYVKGVGSASTAILPSTGDEIMFRACRYPIAPGQRFGLWIRIIRHEDGLAGPETAYDFLRDQPFGA